MFLVIMEINKLVKKTMHMPKRKKIQISVLKKLDSIFLDFYLFAFHSRFVFPFIAYKLIDISVYMFYLQNVIPFTF